MTDQHDREQAIQILVEKRKGNFDYIKRAHQGKVHWMNVIKLSKARIETILPAEKLRKRVKRWFYLGFSIGKLLELPTGANVLRALYQLMEEYDHWIAHGGKARQMFPPNDFQASRVRTNEKKNSKTKEREEHLRASIMKVGRQVVYQYFKTPSICIVSAHMDYCEVVYSLCDVMSLVYQKFLDDSCRDLHRAIFQADGKIKTLVLAKMSQDLTAVAVPELKSKLKGLLSHMFDDVSDQQKQPERRQTTRVGDAGI